MFTACSLDMNIKNFFIMGKQSVNMLHNSNDGRQGVDKYVYGVN